MARRFARVDLSNSARDFRPVAVEPGLPLLDRSSANSDILFGWLGGLVAEPEWEEESVNFFVRDDQGGRFEEIDCQPAGDEDLEGALRSDFEALHDRLGQAKPETSSERAVHAIVLRNLRDLTDDEYRSDRENYFFKYRDVLGRWRLVWCWGYQRLDVEPAAALVCTDPECNLLFVRRPKQSPKCPACEAAILSEGKKRPSRRRALLAGLFVVLVACLATCWFLTRSGLVATPGNWSGPVGSSVAFQVHQRGFFHTTDIGREAVVVVADPRVIRFDPYAATAVAESPGRTLVYFYFGGKSTTATVRVSGAQTPDRIRVDPELVELGIGTTAHLKLVGEYSDGTTAELTRSAEWAPKSDGVVFAHNGFLEGLGEGTSTVEVRYRAGPGDEPLEASANVSVHEVDFQGLELGVDPDPVPLGRASGVAIDAVSESGKRYSLAGSSRLSVGIEPSYRARLERSNLVGEHPGRGILNARFADRLDGNAAFEVAARHGVDELVVKPHHVDMIVGEVSDLSVASPSREPIRMSSSDREVVAIGRRNRLVGRAEGTAQVRVQQGEETRTVAVVVTGADIESIAIRPARVIVPVDHWRSVRLMGHIAQGRDVELAADRVTCKERPSPRHADFDDQRMQVHGIRSTADASPQSLELGHGKLTAEAPVEVVVAPLRLELTPSGKVDLPLGQLRRIDAWANYGGGYRVRLPAHRVDWHGDPPGGALPGLDLRANKVAALEAGKGPLQVWGSYLGSDSPRTTFQSVEAGPVELSLDVDRVLRLSSEPGHVMLLGTGPHGHVELVPELATFKSSNSDVLNLDATSGTFRAGTPGRATVTGGHAASSEPASLDFGVVDPANAQLVFEPRSMKLAVDEAAPLDLFLEVKRVKAGKDALAGNMDSGSREVERARMSGPGVSYSLGRVDAVRWNPPTLVGLRPADRFEMTASYLPYLLHPAVAHVEVTGAEAPTAIRVVPDAARLAPGQTVAVKVEAQWPGTELFSEVRADAVGWDVPPRLPWEPATTSLRPTVTLPDDATGRFNLTATYRGQTGSCAIDAVRAALDPADPAVKLFLEREPPGRYVPVGTEQRYSIFLEGSSGIREPATKIAWPEDFATDYIAWKAPVLTAKQAGEDQWLWATVGGRRVRWHVQTIDPFEPGDPPSRRADQPIEVVIRSDQGPAVRFPVGAAFDDFRIEARYADGFTRMVTKKATMRSDAGFSGGPVAFSGGKIVGVGPGEAVVRAAFDGVPTEQGLAVRVTGEVEVDTIRIRPTAAEILPGETVAFEAEGFRGERSIGVITGLGGLTWRSENDQVVGTSGPAATGRKPGQARVTAQFGSVTSEPARVSVVDSIGADLVVDNEVVRMHVGESRRVGVDVTVSRGGVDFSHSCEVTPSLPRVVRYVPTTRSLVGVSPGVSAVTFAQGDKLATATVQVVAAGTMEGRVVVEPAAAVVSPGHALDLRVFLITPEGRRLDRTDSAVLVSSTPGNVAIRGTRACALAAGASRITAALPEAEEAGEARIAVDGEPISALVVEPSRLSMSVGDSARLRILGRSASGIHPLFAQPDLAITTKGETPQSLRIVGSETVDALAAGSAEVSVDWQKRLHQEVPVVVAEHGLAELVIEPARATIHPGNSLVYRVTGLRGGRRRVFGPNDGVELFVGDRNVARSAGGMFVLGIAPGQTRVVAQVGSRQAEALLTVTPGSGPLVGSTAPIRSTGYGYVVGDSWIDGDRHIVIRDGRRYVIRRGDVDVIDLPAGVSRYRSPAAGVSALRFLPGVVRLGTDSPGVPVQVIEVLADGSWGRNVSTDPSLELNTPGRVARVDRTPRGLRIRPVAPGETRVAARLGTELFSEPELLVQVGDVPAGLARLNVVPNPLDLWSGEARGFDRVSVLPGPGQFPVEVDYAITVAAGAERVVSAETDGRLRGRSVGETRVILRVVEPGTAYDGIETTATVRVRTAERMWVEPQEVSLGVGRTTPPLAVMVEWVDGRRYEVPALLESTDPTILQPAGPGSRSFVARSLGSTQVRGVYRNREAFASVTVTGRRFIDVRTTLDERADDFSVSTEVLAAKSEGRLEYRAYVAGQPPREEWVLAEPFREYQKAILESRPIPYQARSARYHLIIEARSAESGTVQKYPFTFRLAPNIERTDLLKD